MIRLFVFQSDSDKDYLEQLGAGFKFLKSLKKSENIFKIDIQNLTTNFLIKNKIDIVISNGLTQKHYSILKKLKIISITLDNLIEYGSIADITIDFKEQASNRYFTGEKYSLKDNSNIAEEFSEITDIIKKLKWDSNFWGFPVAYLSCRYLTESIMYRINKFVKYERIVLIEYLCNCHDSRSVVITAKNNFIFADIRLSFEKKIQNKERINLPAELSFGLASSDNIKDLVKISKDLYLDSRYYYDENFNKKKASIFYQNWVKKAVLGTFDDECYCLFEKHTNNPIGFCTIKYNLSGAASIGLVGLSEKYQNKGLAQMMLNLVFNKLLEKKVNNVYVVTQGRNFAAQKLYQRLGFLTKNTEIWYHKWLLLNSKI